jgi:hypothetical protein
MYIMGPAFSVEQALRAPPLVDRGHDSRQVGGRSFLPGPRGRSGGGPVMSAPPGR